MKILIVGNRNHQFIFNYVKHAKKFNPDLHFDIISYETKHVDFPNDYLFDNIYCPVIPTICNKIIYLRYIFRHFRLLKIIQRIHEYDYIHIHYLENVLLRTLIPYPWKAKGKLIVTIWGSDFYKRNSNNRLKLLPILKNAHHITLATDNFQADFEKFYSKYELSSKYKRFLFGLEPLSYFNKINRENDNNIHLTIGYNARHNQMHLEILQHIVPVLQNNPNIIIHIPLTYPKRNDGYIEEIVSYLDKNNVKYRLYLDFMSDYEVAILRKKTDIFIQLQKTDVFSGSMLEHLAAGSIVITGNWLPYNDLDEWGVSLIKLESRSDVGSTLLKVLNDYCFYKEHALRNSAIVLRKCSWESLINQCVSVYD